MLFAPDEATARELLRALLEDRDRYAGLGRHDTIGALNKRFELYMTHHRNGKASLELAGVDLTGVDWLNYLLGR